MAASNAATTAKLKLAGKVATVPKAGWIVAGGIIVFTVGSRIINDRRNSQAPGELHIQVEYN